MHRGQDESGELLSDMHLLLMGPPATITMWVKVAASNFDLFTPRAFHAAAKVDWWRIVVVGGERPPEKTDDEALILNVDVWAWERLRLTEVPAYLSDILHNGLINMMIQQFSRTEPEAQSDSELAVSNQDDAHRCVRRPW